MDKFQCLNCVKLFQDNEELFIYNQYCTGFCNLLHSITVNAQAAGASKEIEREELEAA